MPQDDEVAEVERSTYRLTGLDDPDTARTLERELARAEGVERVQIDYLRALVYIDHDAEVDPGKRILAGAAGLGLGVTPLTDDVLPADGSARAAKWTRVAAFALGAWALVWWGLSDHVGVVVSDMAFALTIIVACSVMWRRAAVGIASRRLSAAALMSLVIIGLAATGRWGEGAMLALVVNVADLAQLKILGRYRAKDPILAGDAGAITRRQRITASTFTGVVVVLAVVRLVMMLTAIEGPWDFDVDSTLVLLAAASPAVFLVAGRAADTGRRAFLAPNEVLVATVTFKLALVLLAASSFIYVWDVVIVDQVWLAFVVANTALARSVPIAVADTV